MKYGYARVSTEKQILHRQLDSLTENGVLKENIFCDKKSGKNRDRDGYVKLKKVIKKGDEVYIHALDRLSRNKKEMIEEIAWYREQGILLRVLNVPTTLMKIEGQEWLIEMINNIIFEVLSSFIEQERLEIVTKTKEGLKATKKRGTKLGRKEVSNTVINEINSMIDSGMGVSEACSISKISRTTYYKHAR